METLTIRKIFCLLVFIIAALNFPDKAYAAIIGNLSNITDQGVYGSVYDSACPNKPVQVNIYHDPSEPGVVCQSGFLCPWSNVCVPDTSDPSGFKRTGFWCLYRHPVDSSSIPNQINVTAIKNQNCAAGDNKQLNWYKNQGDPTLSPPSIQIFHQRETNTILIDKPLYKIGISKRWGAGVAEYYNKRNDTTMSLIQPDPGAMLAAAIFGDYNHLVNNVLTGTLNCVNNTDNRYNPTQGGSHCPSGVINPSVLNSAIEECTADGVQIDCQNLDTNFTGHILKFKVHFRNFYYPLNLAPYNWQSFDDLYGYITYTFEDEYVQIDWQLWKISDNKYGSSFQQIPTAFLNQLTMFTYQKAGNPVTFDAPYPSPYQNNQLYLSDDKDGRWITARVAPENPYKTDNYLTLAFYAKPYQGQCPERKFQMERLTNDGNAPFIGVVQNNMTFELKKNNYVEFRTLIFPYLYKENLPNTGKSVGQLVNTYQKVGGFMPDWECNMPTPTPTPIPGDLNSDGHVDIFDYNILIASFGIRYTIFDYNTLVTNYDK